jgi:general secretion pathway protein G
MRRRYLSAIFLLIAVLAGGLFYSKQAVPQTLQALVTARYLKRIPTDPFTRKEDWVQHFGSSVIGPDRTFTGLDGVHPASEQVSRNGTLYSTW